MPTQIGYTSDMDLIRMDVGSRPNVRRGVYRNMNLASDTGPTRISSRVCAKSVNRI